MKNYLTLIRKSDFIDLYRYGIIHISKTSSTEFTCTPEELSSHIEVFDELVKFANEFDNAFVYIFIHYALPDDISPSTINIEDVRHIYPLDEEAKREFATSFDERIMIGEPIWNNAIFELQKKWSVQNSLKGAQNLWKIFNISYPIERVQQIITQEIVEQVIEGLYSNLHPEGDLPLTAYLLRYERHAFYPKETIGFFMDAVHTYCNFMSKTEIESIESTKAYAVFTKRKMKSLKYKDIISKCTKEKDLEGFRSALQDNCPEYSYFEVAPLFFALRNKFNEGLEGDYIKFYKECTKLASDENLSIAIYMLGIILGHSKTYDALYESLPLAIFKQKNESLESSLSKNELLSKTNVKSSKEKNFAIETSQSEIPVIITKPHIEELVDDSNAMCISSKMNQCHDEKENEDAKQNQSSSIVETDLFEEQRIKFPFFMIKLTKKGTVPRKPKPNDIVQVGSEEEYSVYNSKGYKFYKN